MDWISKVNILQGTDSTREFSNGNTLPIAARPWGMHHWTLQTAAGPWMFHPSHRKLWGIRLTHQPSPWMGEYASVLVSACLGKAGAAAEQEASAFKIEEAILKPNHLRVELLRYGTVIEMSPSERGALFSFTYGGDESPRVRLTFDGEHRISRGAGGWRGVARDNARGGMSAGFGLHLAWTFDREPCDFAVCPDGGVFTFPNGVRRLELRMAGSFIDEEGAGRILERELSGKSLQEIRNEGRNAWNSLLGRIEVNEAEPSQARVFYSCLYRCLLFPRSLAEQDVGGREFHRSPYDGQVHGGPLCTDNGFWDTYRTVYPLLALVYPDKLPGILEGWLNACRQAGWSPKWASPGLQNVMIGTHFDAVVADAVAKGVTDWNVEEAFTYLWKNATTPSNDGRFGRRGLEEFIRSGYVPSDKFPYAVSRTLDYAYDDFCVAQVARHLGRRAEAEIVEKRIGNYRNVFDSSLGLMRGRLADGGWEPFHEFRWGGAYIEGGPWQHSFNVPHDPLGLAALCGGKESLLRRIDTMLALPAKFESGDYPGEIHEMTEMALAPFGQYAHSNQPVHNYLFYYALLGDPEKTSHWVHRVAGELYSPDRFPGDEDNGEMSAWYVFACLGIYPFCPGRAEYVAFNPVVLSAEIRVPGAKEIVLFGEAPRVGEQPDGRSNVIGHRDLLNGAGLDVRNGPEWGGVCS
ncbi:MAG: GH92 family glycosyl hydrolase [Terrimicrobiaceae bacterium]